MQDINFRINYLSARSKKLIPSWEERYKVLEETGKFPETVHVWITDENVYAEYKKAVKELHGHNSIWGLFIDNDAFEKIKNGDKDWISQAILYLEVDPFYFRSGYFKEKLCKALKQAHLDEDEKIRIQ